MPRAVSARRYAQAVFRTAVENDQLDEWADDLNVLAETAANEDATALLDSPQICLLYTSPSPRDATLSPMPSSA